jgi:hypothetical protein
MGRDTTASKRMAAMRSREKAAGLRRLNVAVLPEVFDKLAAMMKQYNCVSQARMIELLVLAPTTAKPLRHAKAERQVVTTVAGGAVKQAEPKKAPVMAVKPEESTQKVTVQKDALTKKTAPKKLKELLKKSTPIKAKVAAKKAPAASPPAKAETAQLSLF